MVHLLALLSHFLRQPFQRREARPQQLINLLAGGYVGRAVVVTQLAHQSERLAAPIASKRTLHVVFGMLHKVVGLVEAPLAKGTLVGLFTCVC